MLSILESRAICRGTSTTLILAVPAATALGLLGDRQPDDDPSNWTMVALAVIVLSYVAGGAAAGRRAPAAPLTNGAAATAIAFVIIQTGGATVRLLSGDDLSILGMIFNLFLAAAIGVVGAGIGSRRGTLEVDDGEPAG